jgi:deoxyribodipyrimidine photolyase-related protein
MNQTDLFIVLGSQLFPSSLLPKSSVIFMAEDHELCTYYRFHKHKIIFFLASMREYRDELTQAGHTVSYNQLDDSKLSYEEKLTNTIKRVQPDRLVSWEIEDKFMETRIVLLAKQLGLPLFIKATPLFLTTRAEFKHYLTQIKKPFMKTFYERQRRRLEILVDADGAPIGGKFSFDEDNRKSLPKSVLPPPLNFPTPTKHVTAIQKLVEERFRDHPGSVENFWLPVTRAEAQRWLDRFFQYRFQDFGIYEDALSTEHDFIFHSVISPLLNIGLLLPERTILQTLKYADENEVPLNSTEGFIRQIIGWREFVRGIYQEFSQKQETTNFFRHERKLNQLWYSGETGLAPVDHAIKKARTWGWNHHIERLMVLSNTMLLCEIHPHDVHQWFMEMYVDSSEWVMGPNVFGMGQFSDGGIFATKPYICGSNYILKMGNYKKGPWCEEMDALYWTFIDKHRVFYSKNPRMSIMAKSVARMDPKKLAHFHTVANATRKRLTEEG